ncbi:MAG: NUDIX domain-containing protein [Cyclobacteriaceae bacterium]
MIDKLAWIFLQDGKILMTRSRNKDTFYIPGGKREAGETDEQALLREIAEELSVRLIPKSLQPAGTFQAQAHGQPEGVEVRMQCYFADYEGQLKAAAEIAEMAWFTYAHLPEVGPVDKLIFRWLHDRQLLVD